MLLERKKRERERGGRNILVLPLRDTHAHMLLFNFGVRLSQRYYPPILGLKWFGKKRQWKNCSYLHVPIKF